MPTFTIILPTTMRPTLARTLESIKRQQLIPGDEVLLVSDGFYPGCKELWESSNLPGRFIEIASGPSGDYGHTPRNLTMNECRTSHILHMDDDDAYKAGAFSLIREKVSEFPDSLHMFGLGIDNPGKYFWNHHRIECGNVDTKMFVQKNDGKWGVWGNHHGGDAEFIVKTASYYEDVKWWPDVIAIIRPRDLSICGFEHG